MAVYSHFVGRIGKDGTTVLSTKNGGKFISLDVATDYYEHGEDKTMWIRVISSKERHVEKLAQYLTKGKLIMVQGMQINSNNWIGKDNKAHSQVTIVADIIDFVKIGKKQNDGSSGSQGQSVDSAEEKSQENPFPAPKGETDDVPF